MFPSIPNAARAATLGLLLAGAAALPAQAQFAYQAGDALITTSTYTPLGAGATAITVANNDDANSAAQNIGFSFNYNGQPFTQFVFNTNGFIKLGAAAPSAADLYYTDPKQYTPTSALESTDPADVNIIAPFNYDLIPGTGAVGFKVETTGAAPNRVCTIEWANVSDKQQTTGNPQYRNFSFQLKLNEGGAIDFVYGTATAAAGAPGYLGAPAGLIGDNTAPGALLATKGSTQAWNQVQFIDSLYDATQNRLNFRSDVRPTAGLTYKFSPQVPNDIAVLSLYSLGQLPIPFGAPHAVQALVVNKGLNAQASVTVTLGVSGATTFTDTQTLTNVAPGDSILVTFADYTPTVAGANTLAVSVPNDDNANNNSKLWQQEVTTDTYRYADDSPPSGIIGLPSPGLWLVKHTTSQPKALLSTSFYISNDPDAVGKQYYGVLADDQGTELARTPNFRVTAADLGAYHTFNFAAAPAVPVGDFYVGFGQVTGSNTESPLGYQDETPARAGAYFAFFAGAFIDIATQVDIRPMISATLGVPAACQAPDNLSLFNIGATTASVSFDPASGAQDYTVFYGPTGFTPGGAGSQSVTTATASATLTGLTSSTAYQVYVRTNCSATSFSANNGPFSFRTTCVAPVISTFPYAVNFDTPAASQQLACGLSVVDANNDGIPWSQINNDTLAANTVFGARARSAPNFMGYTYTVANGADDWFFLPAMQVPSGASLRASWWQAATFGGVRIWDERLEVKWGTAATAAAMTNTIYPATLISDSAYVFTQSQLITGTGTVYIGFHCISDPDELILCIDDITVERVSGVANTALARAVSVFPNPTTGKVSISLTETGATRVALRVVDNLGRVVYTGSMHDNAIKNVDLSNLSNGLYTVQVTLDDQVVTKQVNVLK
jgi:trimeric autotransporter adhesin